MPGGNGTGPAGMGQMTGRAAGFCAGFSAPGYMNPASGRGYFGRGRGCWGRGGGRGWARAGYGFPAQVAPTAKEELEGLKQQAEFLQSSLSQISERIEQFEKEDVK